MTRKVGPLRLHWRDDGIDVWLTFTGVSTAHYFFGAVWCALDTEAPRDRLVPHGGGLVIGLVIGLLMWAAIAAVIL